MIWKTESLADYQKRMETWHRWFAWKPVYPADNSGGVCGAWLIFLERRAHPASWDGYGGIIWEYRLIKDDKHSNSK